MTRSGRRATASRRRRQPVGGDHGVDRRAVMIAGPAPPPLHPGAVDADGHRRMGVGMIPVRAVPAAPLTGGAGEGVEQRPQVDTGQQLVAIDRVGASAGDASPVMRAHRSVGVGQRDLVIGDDVVDDGGAAGDDPQRPVRRQPADELDLLVVEPQPAAGLVELVGGLAEHDAGGDVAEHVRRHLRRRRAVVGLGPQVRQAVGDEDVPDPVQPAQLQPGLQRPWPTRSDAGRRPHLVFDEDAAAALVLQGGHLGHQPVVRGHLHQRQGVGVVEHAGQVDDQARRRPPSRRAPSTGRRTCRARCARAA